ncbi:MarR family winged helix-turn-helix transcriptional regulator [Ammoniphilus sp. YIM 78166]|uniref:MarR family winged helix-turn-helix transcriptional regulator n=1 Tax=Ammoniphilus sp. YIM 78166 TaxID=1644106 RepID=UPI00106F5F84|nr:MarR family transcriptional regulator [Ammoniphilus sp. YIM 78166]
MCEEKNDTITRDLFKAFRNIKHVSQYWRQPVAGCTPGEVMMLLVVRESMEKDSHGLKASELSGRLRVTSPTVTQMLNVMEARGLIERGTDPVDRRAVRIRLTEAGREVTILAKKAVDHEMELLIRHLGAERSQQLIELLNEVFSYYKTRTDEAGECE